MRASPTKLKASPAAPLQGWLSFLTTGLDRKFHFTVIASARGRSPKTSWNLSFCARRIRVVLILYICMRPVTYLLWLMSTSPLRLQQCLNPSFLIVSFPPSYIAGLRCQACNHDLQCSIRGYSPDALDRDVHIGEQPARIRPRCDI